MPIPQWWIDMRTEQWQAESIRNSPRPACFKSSITDDSRGILANATPAFLAWVEKRNRGKQ